eukprot:6425298-Prymnesium_polylepis.1
MRALHLNRADSNSLVADQLLEPLEPRAFWSIRIKFDELEFGYLALVHRSTGLGKRLEEQRVYGDAIDALRQTHATSAVLAAAPFQVPLGYGHAPRPHPAIGNAASGSIKIRSHTAVSILQGACTHLGGEDYRAVGPAVEC